MAPTATLDELFRVDLSLTLRASNEEEALGVHAGRPDGATFEIESVTFFDVDPDSGEEWVVEPTPSRVLGVLAGGGSRPRTTRAAGRPRRRRRPPSRSWATGLRCCSGWTRRSSSKPGSTNRAQQIAAEARPAQGGDEHESERTLWCVSEHAQEPTPRWPASASEMQATVGGSGLRRRQAARGADAAPLGQQRRQAKESRGVRAQNQQRQQCHWVPTIVSTKRDGSRRPSPGSVAERRRAGTSARVAGAMDE